MHQNQPVTVLCHLFQLLFYHNDRLAGPGKLLNHTKYLFRSFRIQLGGGFILFYFFEFACGVSGYVLGVNPFNQPGVESYKKNMFALLGKPGYEKEREELLARL